MTFHSHLSLHLEPTPSTFLLGNNLSHLLSPPFFKNKKQKQRTSVACHRQSLSQCKKNGQFTASVQAGQPSSSLAMLPVPRPLSHNPSSHAASPSCPVSPAFCNASPSHTDLANLLDPHSDLDSGPTFVASHSRSASPTIPAPNHSRSPSPTTSDFPTSLESSQLDDV